MRKLYHRAGVMSIESEKKASETEHVLSARKKFSENGEFYFLIKFYPRKNIKNAPKTTKNAQKEQKLRKRYLFFAYFISKESP